MGVGGPLGGGSGSSAVPVGEEELQTGADTCRWRRLGRGLRAQLGGGERLVAEACAASGRHRRRREEAAVAGEGGRRQSSPDMEAEAWGGRESWSWKGGGESRVVTLVGFCGWEEGGGRGGMMWAGLFLRAFLSNLCSQIS
jgi:hypothetical protein